MAKPTIKELQARVDLYKKTIDLVTKDNTRLYKELEDVKDNKNVVSQKEYDVLLSDMELLKLQREEYKNLYFREKQKGKVQLVKNSRNAGRKPIQDELKNKALKLKEQGLSIRNIAKELGIAVGTVHKIINEQNNS